jgi:mono/diheme cytochrome c family protein
MDQVTDISRGAEKRAVKLEIMKLHLLSLFSFIATLGAPLNTHATESIDPACAAPARDSAVWIARAKLEKHLRLSRTRALHAENVPPTQLGLSWNAQKALPQLFVRGPAAQLTRVDSTPDIAHIPWQTFLTVNLPANGFDWMDAVSAPNQFYRLSSLALDPSLEEADDFLLLDHEGKARELFYPSNLKALVVATAGDSIEQLAAVFAALTPLAQTYGTKEVQYWVLSHDPAITRSNLATRVRALGAKFPVLLDPEGWSARALRFSRAGEVTVIQPPAFTYAYRGQLDLTSPTPAQQPYLSAALAGVIQGKSIDFLRTPLTGVTLATLSAHTPSYSTEIAPIFHQHCAICHQPNDVAPFAMTNYETIASWAPAIKNVLLSGQMPPWHADPNYGQWSNNLALPPSTKSALLRWVDAGAPRGDGPDPLAEQLVPPSFRKWPEELGPPDAIVTPGEQTVKLVGIEKYRYIFVQAPNPTSVWLRAAVILPSSPTIVHHYLVWPGKIGNGSRDPDVSTYDASLVEYVPGVKPYIYPADSGVPLNRSNWLTFNLHYTPDGVVTNDLPKLALWYHKTKPAKTYRLANGFANDTFKIPPGNPEFPVEVPAITIDHSIRVHRFNPHMHLRGKRMSYEAVYPNGTRETLLSVPDYDFRWQVGYELTQPKTLPAGTRILIKGAFDNSLQNLANPDPTATVIWGDQTAREMFVGFMDYVD